MIITISYAYKEESHTKLACFSYYNH